MMTPPPTSDCDAARGARPRVLVIDDDPVFRSLVTTMLQRDYTVTAAVDGSDGFERALKAPPEIAVIDIQMPVWDGLRTIRAFREDEILRRVGLIVLSSDACEETLRAAIAAGADDYAIKAGFSRDEFFEKIERVRRTHHQPIAPRAALASSAAESFRTFEHDVQEVIDAWE